MTADRDTGGFPNARTTYLPSGFSQNALERFGLGIYDALHAELRQMDKREYERAGVDRALAIACDLAIAGMRPGASILDIGCSTGTIARLLAEAGYQVTGVDSEVVADVQGWHDPQTIRRVRASLESANCRFVTSSAASFLEATEQPFDAILLLSVLHHFLSGYGYSGAGSISAEGFAGFLKLVCTHARSYLYVESPGPEEYAEMPPDPLMRFLFPGYFVDAHLATDVHYIASTVATSGKPRRLYRVDLI